MSRSSILKTIWATLTKSSNATSNQKIVVDCSDKISSKIPQKVLWVLIIKMMLTNMTVVKLFVN